MGNARQDLIESVKVTKVMKTSVNVGLDMDKMELIIIDWFQDHVGMTLKSSDFAWDLNSQLPSVTISTSEEEEWND